MQSSAAPPHRGGAGAPSTGLTVRGEEPCLWAHEPAAAAAVVPVSRAPPGRAGGAVAVDGRAGGRVAIDRCAGGRVAIDRTAGGGRPPLPVAAPPATDPDAVPSRRARGPALVARRAARGPALVARRAARGPALVARRAAVLPAPVARRGTDRSYSAVLRAVAAARIAVVVAAVAEIELRPTDVVARIRSATAGRGFIDRRSRCGRRRSRASRRWTGRGRSSRRGRRG